MIKMSSSKNHDINMHFLQSILSEFVHDFSSIATGITVGIELLNNPLSDIEIKESKEILLNSSKKLTHFIEFYRSLYNLDINYIICSTKKYFLHLNIKIIWNVFVSSRDYNIILVFLLIWLSKKIKKNSMVIISNNVIEFSNANILQSEIDILNKDDFYKKEKINTISPMLKAALEYSKRLNFIIEFNKKNNSYFIHIKKHIK